jgi:hypothetical protein
VRNLKGSNRAVEVQPCASLPALRASSLISESHYIIHCTVEYNKASILYTKGFLRNTVLIVNTVIHVLYKTL